MLNLKNRSTTTAFWGGLIILIASVLINQGLDYYQSESSTAYQAIAHQDKPGGKDIITPKVNPAKIITDEEETMDSTDYLLLSQVLTIHKDVKPGQPADTDKDLSWVATHIRTSANPEKTGLQKKWLPAIDKNAVFTGEHFMVRDFIVLSKPPEG